MKGRKTAKRVYVRKKNEKKVVKKKIKNQVTKKTIIRTRELERKEREADSKMEVLRKKE